MTELAFLKFNHQAADATLTVKAVAALYKPFDLVTAKPDGWAWGDQEVSNPWFRIIRWSAVSLTQVQPYMSTLQPVLDANGLATTLFQARGFFLDLSDVRIPPALWTWWQDDTRAQPIFVVPGAFVLDPVLLQKVRAAVPDPAYQAPGTPSAITS